MHCEFASAAAATHQAWMLQNMRNCTQALAVGCVWPNLACLGNVGQCASHVLCWREGATYARQTTDLRRILITPCCSTMIQLSKWIKVPKLGKNIKHKSTFIFQHYLRYVCPWRIAVIDRFSPPVTDALLQWPLSWTPNQERGLSYADGQADHPYLTLRGNRKRRWIRCRIYNWYLQTVKEKSMVAKVTGR